MVFKKPYAFLIKYFKLINIVLTVLTAYIVYRSYRIVTFFNTYVTNNYTGNYYAGFSNAYISPILYITITLIILGVSAIIILLLNRKKPIKAYVATILYYVILIIYFNIVNNAMVSLEKTVMTAETARLFRDISLIVIIPQISFVILYLVRGLGFNLKKFNFEIDIKEFEVSAQDNEEIELTFKNDGVKLKRNVRRFFREFLYYIKENKFIFIIIVLVLLVIIVYIIYKSFPEIVDQNYKQGATIINNDLQITFEDSIITNIDYKGDIIDNNYYLVVKMIIENTSAENKNIDYNVFRVISGKKSYYPNVDQSINFIDYASSCHVGVIKGKSKQTCALSYQISETEIQNAFKVKVQNGNIYSDGIRKPRFNYISLTPALVNQITVESTVSLGEKLNFQNSNLGNTLIVLSNPTITDKYVYNYDFCDEKNVCNTYKDIVNIDYLKNNKLLLILNYEFTSDVNTEMYNFTQNINKILDTFVKVKYIEGNNFNYTEVKNVTPSKLKDKIVLETSNKINDLDSFYLSFIIRNKEYLIKIK